MSSNKKTILILHGPNLNLLGTREPDIYGSNTLTDINKALEQKAKTHNITLFINQFNHEGDIVDCIQSKAATCNGIIINPAAFTHTSVAIRDTLAAIDIPAIEVHLSNIYQRESFRHTSHIAPVCIGQISGFGLQSYLLALDALISHLN
jgi:3-dehydroquinate dehydratase II